MPLQVSVGGGPGLTVEAFELPSGKSFQADELSDDFMVVERAVDIKGPFYLSDETTDDVTLIVGIGYQACTESVCFVPGAEH